MTYSPARGVAYARQWAYARNPIYYDFDPLGGDCTNFVSQCLYAACGVMNDTPETGWYYYSLSRRSASWSGVPFLHEFLTGNTGPGPYGHEAPLEEAKAGDIVQLSFDGKTFSHSLYVVSARSPAAPDNIQIATHTFNAFNRFLGSYSYISSRLIALDGAR